MKITSLFSKNKTHFSQTHIFLLFLCKIPSFYTVSLSLITVYNFLMFYAFKTTFLRGDNTNYHVTDTSFLTSGDC